MPGTAEWFLLISISFLLIFRKQIFGKRNSGNSNQANNKSNQSDKTVNAICSHCKSPNPNKLNTCEWCGNKIN